MNKKDLKKLCLLGLTCGATLAAQSSANAAEGVTLAGGCGGMSSPRSSSQTSDNYMPSHSCSSQAAPSGYYAPAPISGSSSSQSAPRYNSPSHSCSAYAPAPQGPQSGSCSGQRPAGGYTQGDNRMNAGYTQGDNRMNSGSYYNQQEGNRNFNSQNQQWGQSEPNAGNSKNFPSTMSPAQGNNPMNNQNLQNPTTK